MDNALNNENLGANQGEVKNNVGQDEGTQQQASETNWEDQAKYFQSEKDKALAENQKLKQYEQIGRMLESRPDIVGTVSTMLQGGQSAQPVKVQLTQDEFDPWEAYNDPSSKSYLYRQQELQESINEAVQGQMAGVQKQVGMGQLKTELANKGLNNEEINSFVDFASKNPAEYGVDGAINMWKSVTQQPTEGNQDNFNPYDSIRQNEAPPQQAGVLNGEQPIRKDEAQKMWEDIMNAGSRTKVL